MRRACARRPDLHGLAARSDIPQNLTTPPGITSRYVPLLCMMALPARRTGGRALLRARTAGQLALWREACLVGAYVSQNDKGSDPHDRAAACICFGAGACLSVGLCRTYVAGVVSPGRHLPASSRHARASCRGGSALRDHAPPVRPPCARSAAYRRCCPIRSTHCRRPSPGRRSPLRPARRCWQRVSGSRRWSR